MTEKEIQNDGEKERKRKEIKCDRKKDKIVERKRKELKCNRERKIKC